LVRSEIASRVLGDGGQDVNRRLVGVGVIDRHELNAGVHQRCNEGEIARQAIE
jgi:hypothetical protein